MNENSQYYIEYSQDLQKCRYCKGKDGKDKDIYETYELAFNTIKYIEENRKIILNIYKCPYNNGWHLTKNNAYSINNISKDIVLQNDNIPIRASDGSWEFIKDEFNEEIIIYEDYTDEKILEKNIEKNYSDPISRVECKSTEKINSLTGKVIEIVENINIEKIFKINSLKEIENEVIKSIFEIKNNQITIFVDNKENNNINSYSIIIKKKLFKKYNIVKGSKISLNLEGVFINNIYRWYCNKILLFNN